MLLRVFLPYLVFVLATAVEGGPRRRSSATASAGSVALPLSSKSMLGSPGGRGKSTRSNANRPLTESGKAIPYHHNRGHGSVQVRIHLWTPAREDYRRETCTVEWTSAECTCGRLVEKCLQNLAAEGVATPHVNAVQWRFYRFVAASRTRAVQRFNVEDSCQGVFNGENIQIAEWRQAVLTKKHKVSVYFNKTMDRNSCTVFPLFTVITWNDFIENCVEQSQPNETNFIVYRDGARVENGENCRKVPREAKIQIVQFIEGFTGVEVSVPIFHLDERLNYKQRSVKLTQSPALLTWHNVREASVALFAKKYPTNKQMTWKIFEASAEITELNASCVELFENSDEQRFEIAEWKEGVSDTTLTLPIVYLDSGKRYAMDECVLADMFVARTVGRAAALCGAKLKAKRDSTPTAWKIFKFTQGGKAEVDASANISAISKGYFFVSEWREGVSGAAVRIPIRYLDAKQNYAQLECTVAEDTSYDRHTFELPTISRVLERCLGYLRKEHGVRLAVSAESPQWSCLVPPKNTAAAAGAAVGAGAAAAAVVQPTQTLDGYASAWELFEKRTFTFLQWKEVEISLELTRLRHTTTFKTKMIVSEAMTPLAVWRTALSDAKIHADELSATISAEGDDSGAQEISLDKIFIPVDAHRPLLLKMAQQELWCPILTDKMRTHIDNVKRLPGCGNRILMKAWISIDMCPFCRKYDMCHWKGCEQSMNAEPNYKFMCGHTFHARHLANYVDPVTKDVGPPKRCPRENCKIVNIEVHVNGEYVMNLELERGVTTRVADAWKMVYPERSERPKLSAQIIGGLAKDSQVVCADRDDILRASKMLDEPLVLAIQTQRASPSPGKRESTRIHHQSHHRHSLRNGRQHTP